MWSFISRNRWHRSRPGYYIVWTEGGRSRERSTGTADREEAEIELARFLRGRTKQAGPRDPSEILVTDILTDYMEKRAPQRSGAEPYRICSRSARVLLGRPNARRNHAEDLRGLRRKRAISSTVRRELGVLRAAVQFSFANGEITRVVPVAVPAETPSRNRG